MSVWSNPRSEVVVASHHSCGSLADQLDSPPSHPPPSPPSQPPSPLLSPLLLPDEDDPNLPPVYKADAILQNKTVVSKVNHTLAEVNQKLSATEWSKVNQQVSAPVVSKVRKMKELFQATCSDTDVVDHKLQPVTSHHDQFPLSTHMQRFNYTRALFARMEVESKQQIESDRSVSLQRPSTVSGLRSPVMSKQSKNKNIFGSLGNVRDSSSSDEGKVTTKQQFIEDTKSVFGASLGVSVPTRRSRANNQLPVRVRKPDVPRPAYSEPNIAKAVSSSVGNTPGGFLRQRRQNDILSDSDKFHDLTTHRKDLSSLLCDNKTASCDTLDDSGFNNSYSSLFEDLSVTSAYHSRKPHSLRDNVKFIQGQSASPEVLSTTPSNDFKRSLPEESQDHNLDLRERNVNRGGKVQMWSSVDKNTNSGKRLSKEKMQSSVNHVDTYVQSNNTSYDEDHRSHSPTENGPEMGVSDITVRIGQTDVTPEQKMVQSDTSVQLAGHQVGEMRSWAKYRNQRYGKQSYGDQWNGKLDQLEGNILDGTKHYGDISNVNVSGNRKSSMENLAKLPEPTADIVDISQTSVTSNKSVGTEQKPTSDSLNISEPLLTIPFDAREDHDIVMDTTDGYNIMAKSKAGEHFSSVSSGLTYHNWPLPLPHYTAPLPSGEPTGIRKTVSLSKAIPLIPTKRADIKPNTDTGLVHKIAPPVEHGKAVITTSHHGLVPNIAPPVEYSKAVITVKPSTDTGLIQRTAPPFEHSEAVIATSTQSEMLSSITVTDQDQEPLVQIRPKVRTVAVEESSTHSQDFELPLLERKGSRNALYIDTNAELPLREEGDGIENPEKESSIPSDPLSQLLFDKLPPPPAYPGHSKLSEHIIIDSENDLPTDDGKVQYLEIEGLSSTSSDSEDEHIKYEPKKDKKITFCRHPIKVFMTYSTEDYDRKNEDVDPVAASAEYELEKRVDRMDVFQVDLMKGPTGLGLSIIGMGVGADAGIEKLGIFIKTLANGGAAQTNGKMQVNDQIIEVDGKSLVGVTQAYAASVLRNTSGEVRFLIGREKEPSKSEVARLIQQSLELDRRRDELRHSEHEFIQRLKPSDEDLELNHQQLMSSLPCSDLDDNVNLDESSDEDDVQDQEISDELHTGEATPLLMPPGVDNEESVSSPEEHDSEAVVEMLDLPDSSSSPDDVSPDIASQALLVKLKEAQCKNSLIAAELTKLKGKLIVHEKNEGQNKMFEKQNEEMASHVREVEKSLFNARQEIDHYQDMMKGSQGHYIALEKQMKDEYTALEKKYHKAKKLIKEYQQREKDFIGERESMLQQQSEKDHQYDTLVKSLKDRIFQLEGELREAQKTAGLNVMQPQQTQTLEGEFVPVMSLAVTTLHTVHGVTDAITANSSMTFESVPKTSLLDISAQRTKALLAANSPRRPPTKHHMSKSHDREENLETGGECKFRSDIDYWIIHDSENTVKKSDLKKCETQSTDYSDLVTTAGNTTLSTDTQFRLNSPVGSLVPISPPPPAGAQQSVIQTDTMEPLMDRLDSDSEDSESTISQTSYDPSQPNFLSKNSEIPGFDTTSMDTIDTGNNGDSESSAGGATKMFKGLLPKLPFKLGGNSSQIKSPVTLLSSRSLDGEDPNFSNNGKIIFISKKKIATGFDIDDASTISDSSSGYMVGEVESTTYSFSGTPASQDHPSLPGNHAENQFQSGQITDWNSENVQHWLFGIEMEKYAPLFIEKSINGIQLVSLDTIKLKAMGITNVKDRDYIKKKLKDLRFVLDKEKKQLEKETKQMEKDQRKKEKEQLKIAKKK